MLAIAASGNFSFLNHLTIIPSLACLDDACWPRALRAAPPPVRLRLRLRLQLRLRLRLRPRLRLRVTLT